MGESEGRAAKRQTGRRTAFLQAVLFAAIALALVVVAQRDVVILPVSDSYCYKSAAANFWRYGPMITIGAVGYADGKLIVQHQQGIPPKLLTQYPPGYPFLLSLSGLVSPDLNWAASLLNALAMVCVVLVVWFATAGVRPWLRVLAALSAALCWPLLVLSKAVMSEVVFAALLVATAWAFSRRRWWTTTVLLVALSSVRYVGVGVLVVFVGYLLIRREWRPAAKLSLAAAPILTWLAIAWGGTPLDDPRPLGIIPTIASTLAGLGQWFTQPDIPAALLVLAALVLSTRNRAAVSYLLAAGGILAVLLGSSALGYVTGQTGRQTAVLWPLFAVVLAHSPGRGWTLAPAIAILVLTVLSGATWLVLNWNRPDCWLLAGQW